MEIERVAAIHPLYGQRVVVRDDLAPQGFSVDELHSLYSALMESAHDYNLLMEPPTFAEVDDFLNPGSEQIPPFAGRDIGAVAMKFRERFSISSMFASPE